MSWSERSRRKAGCAGMLLTMSLGCPPADRAAPAPGDDWQSASILPDTGRPVDAIDRIDSVAMSPGVPAARPDTTRPVAGGPRPVLPRPSPDTSRRVRVLHGRAELAIDEKTFIPADYLRVRLRTASGSFETWTNRSGEFIFENVPATGGELLFLAPEKVERVVFRQSLVPTADQTVALPAIHIPADSMKPRTRG